MAVDILKLQKTINDLIETLKGIAPKHWKGNDAPNTHHWDEGSIVADAGVNLDKQTFWVSFEYTDGGIPHVIKATMSAFEPGTPGGADVITLDGADVEGDDFVDGFRMGFELEHGIYHRIICSFKFVDALGAKHEYRFDGDL